MTARKPIVLVIDDEFINIKIMAEALANDCEVVFAIGGQEGIDIAVDIVPNVILLDVVMPDIDGYAVCAQLKNNPRTAAVPIIFITSLDAVEQEVKGLEAGAIDYVTKPIRPSAVRARVNKQLEYKNVLLAAANAVQDYPPECETLSSRQKEIYKWVRAGKTNWEIARIIGCSEDNVKYHMKKILRVFGSINRTDVAARHVRVNPAGMP